MESHFLVGSGMQEESDGRSLEYRCDTEKCETR